MADDTTYDALLDKLQPLVMKRESSGRLNPPDSSTGAIGPMQIMPETGKMYGADPIHLRIPAVNMSIGRRYLKDLLKKYDGDVYATLAAYNAGPHNVDIARIPDSTRSYVRDIMGKLGEGVSGAMGEGTAEAGEDHAAPGGTVQNWGARMARMHPYVDPNGKKYYSDGKQWFDSNGTPMGAGQAQTAPAMVPSKISIKGMTFTNPDAPTTAEATRRQKMSDQATKILKMVGDMRQQYALKIAPKIASGQIGSTTQGLYYLHPQLGQFDQDVQDWTTKGGPLSMETNAYYAALSGAKGGAQMLETTGAHVPHTPQNIWEVTGLTTGNSWDLGKMSRQLDTIENTVKLVQGWGKPEQYGTKVGVSKKPNGTVGRDKKTGHQVVAFDGSWYDVDAERK